jgi:transposase
MTAEERIRQLEAENVELRGQLAEALEHLEQALERIHELEGQLARDSHNSSKPPSSDGPRRRRRSQRQKSEKPTGGQPGHTGWSLMQIASPDEVVQSLPLGL